MVDEWLDALSVLTKCDKMVLSTSQDLNQMKSVI
jgi:hypothetical protein